MMKMFFLDAMTFFIGAANLMQADFIMKCVGIIISILSGVAVYKGIQERDLRIKILKRRYYGRDKL